MYMKRIVLILIQKMQKPQFSKKWTYASLKLGVPGARPFGLRAL